VTRRVSLAASVVLLLPVVVIGAAVGALSGGPGLGGAALPSATAAATIPPGYLASYQRAAATCPGLPWTVLAAIGQVESDHGRSAAPGVHAGANPAGARGPMQFLPATFAQYASPVPPGGADPPSPYDPVDAVHAAARLLCANGAHGGADLPGAVFAYNHARWYVRQVLTLAAGYAATSGAADAAVGFALAQLGTPYRWGGDGPGGFDCSGLVQAAFAAAGIGLPRTAQQQHDTGPPLPPGAPPAPGDLVFFGTTVTHVTHVGIVVGPGLMVDAPHTGARVRVEPYQRPGLLGATRPTAMATGLP
jgi:cell wall-associated NlpC family hydrolase